MSHRTYAITHQCPYLGCTFQGSEHEVDEHRTTDIHAHQPQAGSNIRLHVTYPPSRTGDPRNPWETHQGE